MRARASRLARYLRFIPNFTLFCAQLKKVLIQGLKSQGRLYGAHNIFFALECQKPLK
jgi:hypothetical protein